MGLEELYWLGFNPSKTPPCGVALSVEVADAEDGTAVTVCVTIEVAMLAITWPTSSSHEGGSGIYTRELRVDVGLRAYCCHGA